MIFRFRMPAAMKGFGVLRTFENDLHVPPFIGSITYRPHHEGFRHLHLNPFEDRFRVVDE